LKKLLKIFFITIAILVAFTAFIFFGPATNSPEDGFLYVKTGTTMPELERQLVDEGVLKSILWFNLAKKLLPFEKVKPGKYKISEGMSVVNLLRLLRNGRQQPVNFVVTKIRTKEQLAARMGKQFEFDSLAAIQFLSSNDSLKDYNLDSNTVMAAVLPLTYENRWNTTPRAVFEKFYNAYKIFWNDTRKQKAQEKGLSITEVITLASIVDEETNAEKEKGLIASVYLNRLAKGMKLQADPTVKFALKNFGIKRVLLKHLTADSPYNTYKNKGLPPGPICTPQESTIDSVLNAPKTDYIYFVASPAFDGTHVFATNYNDHMNYAKAYQQALNERFGKPSTTSENK